MKRQAKPGLALLPIVILLGGCAQFGGRDIPDELASGVLTPSTWSTNDAAIRQTDASVDTLASWWRRLDDPMLDELIRAALKDAPDLRSAQAKLRQARANRDLARANLMPNIGVSASAKRSQSGTDAGGNNIARTMYAAGFDASWEPSIFGGLSDAAKGAEADLAAVAASLDSTRASLAAEVALNYVNLRTAQRRLRIALDNVSSQEETLRLTEWRAVAGLTTALDVEQARTNLAQSRATIPGFENARAEAEHRLAVLTGQVPGALPPRLTSARAMPKAPDDIAVGIPAETLRQRPDVRAAESSLRAEVARSAQQEAARYPSLNLNGSWGWQAFSLASLGGGASLVRSLTGSLAATLFDGGRIASRIEAQDAVQQQAAINYEKTVLTALEDVENALTAYATGRDRVSAREKAATSASNAAGLARTLYQAGSVDFQKVLDTDRTRLTAEDALASADADVLTAVIQLYKALGGGWQHADANPVPNN